MRSGRLIISGGSVLLGDPGAGRFVELDVEIRDGMISRIGRGLTGAPRLDAGGASVMPGLVNSHTHLPMRILAALIPDRLRDEGTWYDAVRQIERLLHPGDIAAGTRLALREQLERGVTTVNEMYHPIGPELGPVRRSGLHAVLSRGMIDEPRFLPGLPRGAGRRLRESETLLRRVRAVPCTRLSVGVAPHSPAGCSDALIRGAAGLAGRYRTILHTHVNEDPADVRRHRLWRGRGQVARLARLGALRPWTVAVHCCTLSSPEIRLLARAGASVVHCPGSNARFRHPICPVRDLRAAGVNVALGTDGAASAPDQDLWAEMARARRLHGLAPFAALGMATQAGAHALGLATGTIVPGARADLLVVSPPSGDLAASVERGHPPRIRAVLVDGTLLMNEGLIVAPGLKPARRVVDEAQRATEGLRDRARRLSTA